MIGGPLLERESELAEIEAAVGRAASGRGAGTAILFEGPAGIGKTSLLRAAAERAGGHGMTVLRARGEELESALPWGVAIQLFAELAARGEDEDLLAGPAALTRPLFERASTPAEVSTDPFPLLHGLHWLTANLTERAPVLLVVDDAHFADPESLRFVHYLLGRLDGLALALMLAARSGEPVDAATEELLERLRAHPEMRFRSVRPLAEASIHTLVADELPGADSEFTDALATAVAGNPLFCRELLSAIRSEGIVPTAPAAPAIRGLRPEGIRSSIVVRLGRLGAEAGRLARAAAMLGPGTPRAAAAELAGLDEPAAADAVDALVSAGILTAGDGLDFVHPLVREIVEGEGAPAARRRGHLAAARVLHARGASAEQVASHLLAGDPAGEDWALATLREAGARSLSRGAPGRAAALLRAALDDPAAGAVRAGLLVELGRAEVAAGDPAGIERLREALRLAGASPPAVSIALQLGEALYAGGRFREAAAEFDLGLDLLAAVDAADRDPVVEARLLAGLDAAGRLGGLRLERVRSRTEALVDAPPEAPSPAERVLMAMAAGEYALGVERPRERVLALAYGALAGNGDVEALGRAVIEPVTAALMFCDEFDTADAILTGLLERAEQRGEASGFVSLVSFRSYVALARGPLALAVAYAEDAIRVATEVPGASLQALAPARHGLARASLDRGDLATAERAVDVADAAQLWGGSPLYGWFLDALGRVELARGRPAEALAAFRAAGEIFCAAGGPGTVCDWRSGAALAAHSAGQQEQGIALAGEEVELARRFGAPRAIAIALRCRALLSTTAGDAVEPLREAVAAASESQAHVEHSKALVELGAALRRGGWDRDSREPLREGMEAARRCGAVALVERAAAELEASGARRPRLALSGVESLTPSQRRVAEMAASGMSNRQIAAALFVTQRTVETHLSATYGKLEISSREELPAALGTAATG